MPASPCGADGILDHVVHEVAGNPGLLQCLTPLSFLKPFFLQQTYGQAKRRQRCLEIVGSACDKLLVRLLVLHLAQPKQVQLVRDDARDIEHELLIFHAHVAPRFCVHNAARAKPVDLSIQCVLDRRPGIEPNVRRASNLGVRPEPLVLVRIQNYCHIRRTRLDGTGAEGLSPSRVPIGIARTAQVRLGPLVVSVDERHQGNRSLEDPAQEPCQAVHVFFGRSVHDPHVSQREDPLLLVGLLVLNLSSTRHMRNDLASQLSPPITTLPIQWVGQQQRMGGRGSRPGVHYHW
mmetsp:Transcript_23928/g.70189  ORF Transcript_23928/g.70189 Transcript_23928/m.70189 type:complete len:291 (+) Transcript_23928:1708-2580(+)